ncbi:Protein OS-9 [Haplosporangium sp. Z 767]|nr:Protein OS-9 [Haplosporangium sp. Z 767]KAF9181424.1 Protein OS-9 [Haplosporangium sp. Z 11]
MRLNSISPSQAALVACASILSVSLLTPVLSHSVGFVYNDLLAHPQYHVRYLDELVPVSAIGAERLRRGNTHHHHQTRAKAAPQIETIKEQTEGQSAQDSHSPPTVDPASSMIMTDADGQRWSCLIPTKRVYEAKAPPERTPQEMELEKKRSIKRGLELLDHLSGHCLRAINGYWTYEYCHKKRIRQYHAVHMNGQWVPESDDSTHVLAKYQPPPAEIQGHPNNEGSLQQRTPMSSTGRAETVTELGVSNERKYLVQRWGNGDVCDLTGARRNVEVQFQCANIDDRIQAVSEPSTCSYIMVIYSRSLCKDVAFEIIPAPEANMIDCRRIVTDEQYQQLKLAAPEAIDSGFETVATSDAAGQIRLGQEQRQQQQPKQESTLPVGKKLAAGQIASLGMQELSSLLEKMESARKSKHLDEIITELENYFEAQKALMTEDQKTLLKQVEDLVEGNMDTFKLLGYDQNGQAVEMDKLLDAFLGGGVKADKDKRQEKKEQQKDLKLDTHADKMNSNGDRKGDKKDDIFQQFMDSIADNNDKTMNDKDAPQKVAADEILAGMDLQTLLEMLDATKSANTAAENVEKRTQEKGERKDSDEKDSPA